MSNGPVSNFTTTSSLPGASTDSRGDGEMSSTRFGNFEVLTKEDGGLFLLGGGGFGKTYKARHVYLNQIVALKVINDRFLHDASAKERFLREAQVVNQLRHPHIAHVLDFGEVKGALYYAMEFCGGGNLENMVNRVGPLPLPTVLRCARQLAEALGCAHSAGFIHRDVKPANVMLTGADDANPQLKLVDFGLVKNLQQGGSEATAALTMTGQQFFTIQFASPEQLMEEELDARSDLFALGMTLWFLLKGAPPESGSMASIVAKRLDPRSYEAQLPAALPAAYRSLLSRLLEKDRGQRFQGTDDFLAALAAAEADPDGVRDAGAGTDDSGPEAESAPADGSSVTTFYDVLENLGAMPLGVMYRASRKEGGEQVAITMISDALREDPTQRAQIEGNVALLQTSPHETIARVIDLKEYDEGLALVQEWHQGVSLHSILKNARHIPYAEAMRVLTPVAQGTDWTTVHGLPGTVLAMDEIYLQPLDAAAYPEPDKLLETPLKDWPPFRVRLLPYVIREDASQDVGMTLNTEVVSEPTVAFGCILYNLVAGHAPKTAAKLTKSAYVTIGRLAEDSNRLLASVIVNERDFGGCEGVLRTLNTSEGVSFNTAQRAETNSGDLCYDAVRPDGSWTGGRVDGRTGELKPYPPREPVKTETASPRTGGGAPGGKLDPAKTGKKPGDTSSGRGLVVETRSLGTTTGRLNKDLARQTEEARLRKQAEEAEAKARADAETKARIDAETRAKIEADAAAKAEVVARAKAEAETKARADAEAKAKARADAETKAKADAEAKARAKAEADARARADAEARTRARAEADAKARADAEAKAKAKADSDARAKADAEARARAKTEADARAKGEAEAKAKAKQRELQILKPANVGLQPPAVTDSRPPRVEPEPSKPFPVVPVAIGGVVLALAAGAFFLLHKSAPDPTPVVVATPPPPAETAPPVAPHPSQFVFAQGFVPTNAKVLVNGRESALKAQEGRVSVPLTGAAAQATSLTVTAPGYESRTFPIGQDATENAPVRLVRQKGLVKLTANGGSSDYTTAIFRAMSGLKGEERFVSMDPDDLAYNIPKSGAEISLPTGYYLVTLQGPGGASDAKVPPREVDKRLAVTTQGATVTLPAGFPGFAGKYTFEFLFKQDDEHAPAPVKRMILIEPGLAGGRVDDYYTDSAALNTKITDLATDANGVLHGLIRFTQRTDTNKGYDEQFELAWTPDRGFTMVGGGWEIMPADARVLRELKEIPNLKSYQVHTTRPTPRPVTRE